MRTLPHAAVAAAHHRPQDILTGGSTLKVADGHVDDLQIPLAVLQI